MDVYSNYTFLTTIIIIPRAQMGSESIAHETEGWMGYWLRGHERNNTYSIFEMLFVAKKVKF